ncbi:MAG: DSBA-like thioredoxin domain-containing protein [Parcubacteria group bacterium Licking1014_17]|nr:MAG: DSBA-like thioredoxin domain-containing protein [Parcubacteria group bacterium Licking1014_17]
MSGERKIFVGIVVFIVVIFAGVVWLTGRGDSYDPRYILSNDTHLTGNADAKVLIVEFGDYECPACGQMNTVFEDMLKNYSDPAKVSVGFRHFLIPSHKNAPMAAEAAEAADAQSKFWEMHKKLYESQSDWANLGNPYSVFEGYARNMGLNIVKFKADIHGEVYKDVINGDVTDGGRLGINATPTVFINGKKYVGVIQPDQLKQIIDAELAK